MFLKSHVWQVSAFYVCFGVVLSYCNGPSICRKCCSSISVPAFIFVCLIVLMLIHALSVALVIAIVTDFHSLVGSVYLLLSLCIYVYITVCLFLYVVALVVLLDLLTPNYTDCFAYVRLTLSSWRFMMWLFLRCLDGLDALFLSLLILQQPYGW